MAGYKTIVGMVNGMLEELNITVSSSTSLRPRKLRRMFEMYRSWIFFSNV